jgi:hypothetical protein
VPLEDGFNVGPKHVRLRYYNSIKLCITLVTIHLYWDGITVVHELLLLGMKIENPKYMRPKLGFFQEVDKGREFVFILEPLKRGFLHIFGLRTQPDAVSDTSLCSKHQTTDQIRNQIIISVTIYQRPNP